MSQQWRRTPSLAFLLCVALLGLSLMPSAATRLQAAAAPATIYDDALRGWSNWSWGGDYNLASSTQKQSGTSSIAVTYQSGWTGLYLHTDTALNTSGYDTLRFFVHGGGNGGQKLRVCASNNCASGVWEVAAPAGTWQQIDVPLSTFGSPTSINDLLWQDTTGAAQSTFYIDDIALVSTTAPTATSTTAPTATSTTAPTATSTTAPTATSTTAPTATSTTAPTATSTTAPTATKTAIATSAPSATRAATATAVALPLMTATPTSIPATASSATIYGDSLASGWSNWSWGGTYNIAATAQKQSGTSAIGATITSGWGALYLHTDKPLSTAGANALRFFVHGGSTGNQKLRVCTNTSCTGGSQSFTPQSGRWTQVDVPLSALGSPSSLVDLLWQDTSGSPQPIFYVDSISLIGSTGGSQPSPTPPPAGSGLALSVDVAANQKPISPYIYGMNWPNEQLAAELKLPVQRWGGNSVTRYNWQNDVSNKASDWFFENIPSDNANVGALPSGSSSDAFIEQGRRTGSQTLLQIPMIGWTPKSREITCAFPVSRYGAQQRTDSWRPDCGNGIKPDGTPITGNDPTLTSTQIGPQFVQDWMRHLIGRYGTAAQGGVGFYNLDNELGLWNSTHRDVHPQGASYDEIRDRGIQYGAAIKAVDADAKVMGPAEWGWTGYFYSGKDQAAGGAWWSNPQDRNAHGGVELSAWYLQQMRAYEQQNGKRLLDYFDLHYYPQAQGVSLQGAGDANTQALRLRSTRSLWDTTYTDESWIGEPVRLIPRMRDWVNGNYPGTKLAIGEYNWGALDNINGALAQADVLGIFGREGLDFATLWAGPNPGDPGAYAFRMFRNYNGQGGMFGETSVKATSADQAKLAIYAARRSDGTLTVMVINKSGAAQNATIALAGISASSAQVYRYSPANLGAIVREADQTTSGSMSASFPKDSITLFVIR